MEEASDVKCCRILQSLPDIPTSLQESNSTLEQRLKETRLKMNRVSENDEPTEDFPSFEESFTGDLPCPLFYLDNKHLRQFKTFDELTQHVLESERQSIRYSRLHKDLLAKLCTAPILQTVHYSTLGEYLRYLYESDHLMDVHIEVEGETFVAHRLALCCFSRYFSDLLLAQDSKSLPVEVKLLGISAKAFASFLEFVYTGEIAVAPDIAGDMLVISEFLDVQELKSSLNVIASNLPLSKAVKIVVHSRRGSSNQLYEMLMLQILHNFTEAARIAEFLDIDVETFCALLASNELMVSREYDVFLVALRWLVHGGRDRVHYVVRVFELIRFCHMTQAELFACIEETNLFLEHEELRDAVLVANWIITTIQMNVPDPFQFPIWPLRAGYIMQARTYRMKTPPLVPDESPEPKYHSQQSTPMTSRQTSPHSSNPTTPPGSSQLRVTSVRCGKPVMIKTELVPARRPDTKFDILVIGGFRQRRKSEPDTPDTTESKQWVKLCDLPSPRCHHAVVCVEGKIFLLGGCDPASDKPKIPLKLVHRMFPKVQQWTRMANMLEARMNHCACAVRDKIYVFGGVGDRNRVLATAECYDVTLNTWSYIAIMMTPRFAASAATLGNKCYVVGGMTSDDDFMPDRELDLVECYDTWANSWSRKAKLRSPTCYGTLVNVSNTLYLCGGATYSNKLNGLFSHSNIDTYNENTDTWEHVTNMTIPRHAAGVAVAGRRIYIIGGISSPAEQVLCSIECYDTADSKWLPEVETLPFPARWLSCVSTPHVDI